MVDRTPPVKPSGTVSFDGDRMTAFLLMLEQLASGHVDIRLPVSPNHDALDAIAHGINALVGELEWAHARSREAQETQAADLRVAVANAQARSDALLRAIPDLMFVFRRDGTFVDYHARDQRLLWVPPEAFLGRTVVEIMPPPLAAMMMDALERAFGSDAAVVVEYELPLEERRFFEARIVRVDADRLLSIVRDVTEAKRASEINRDLARRLISRQEDEWQQIARELHDDISQRVALLNMELAAAAVQPDAEALRKRLEAMSSQVSEIATDLHCLSYELHPARLRLLSLVPALQALCEDTSLRRGLQVAFSADPIPGPVDFAVSLCLFRIVQESLHNVARHSQSPSAEVRVRCSEREITLEIADSGVGFDAHVQHAGLGLVSMRERVAIVNGQMAIDAAPGGGTRITVRIPLSAGAGSELPVVVRVTP